MLHQKKSDPTDRGHITESNNTNYKDIAAPQVDFESFGLAQPLLRGLNKNGFHSPTVVQAKSIPLALRGRDVLVSAQTGTGKTAAFVLPALQRLLTPAAKEGRGPRVLILTPTRELAGQVEVVIRQMARFTALRSGTVVGGVSYAPQERMLRGGVDLLVATPGRLLDHMARGLMDFSRVEILVLDEADRMLDMGFVKPVQRIAAALPAKRQTLLFSATLEGEVMNISKRLLQDPERIHLSPVRLRNQAITQHMHTVNSPEHKHALLSHFLTDPQVNQAIVFTATKRGADRLTKRLNASGLSCAALHGNMRQNARQKTVDALRRGKVRVLVATDVASRGIDLEGVSHVINFNLPTVPEDYIHRIGRTGRNGATGTAISLVDAQDKVKLNRIERITGHRIERLNVTELRVMEAPAPKPHLSSEREAPQGIYRSETSARHPARAAEKPFHPRRKRPRNFQNGPHNGSRPQNGGSFHKKGRAASAR
ncbi:MAG: DEAD/DEAH box helicase [SAR324 cluster bacterium]|nr:DEAD/DEAH box helicase [SAR324 cluster bacterium]MCZ6728212.1 DEAD/DEAH box helicase [SAR324 cluster bacterium]